MNRNTIPVREHAISTELAIPLKTEHQRNLRIRECDCQLCHPLYGMELQPPEPGNFGLLRGRTFVIDDHENMCGGPNAPSYVSSAIWKVLKDTCSLDTTSHVSVGLSGFSFSNWMTSLPFHQVRLVLGNGKDGADRALLDSIDADHIATRFNSVVIASGDHIFTKMAAHLRERGLLVCNVTSSRAGASRTLAEACSFQVRLKVGARTHGSKWAVAA